MNRKQIVNKIKEKEDEINILRNEIIKLKIQEVQICDNLQRYEEGIEEVVLSKRPKVIKKMLIGRKYWNEDFVDEGTGEVITIERCRIVREDDVWTI